MTWHVFPKVGKESFGLELRVLKLNFCVLFALQTPAWFKASPWTRQQSRECVCRHLWGCVPLFVQAQRVADVHCPYFTEI